MGVIQPKPTRDESVAYLGGGVIRLPPKVSTRARLHEIGHKILGHEPGLMPIDRFISKELDAEIYAWRMMDREPTYRVGVPVLVELIRDWGLDKRESLRLVGRELGKKGIKVGKSARRDLGRFAYEFT